MNNGPCWLEGGGERDVGLDCLHRSRQHGHQAHLAALAGDAQHVVIGRHRGVATVEVEGFGNTQATAIQQREHCGITRRHPGFGVFAADHDLAGCGSGQRLGDGMWQLWRAQRGNCRVTQNAVEVEPAVQRADGRELAGQGAAFGTGIATCGHEGAKVHGFQGFKVAQAGCGTQVALEKPGELGDVSQVGVESMWADLAFDAQMIGPARKGSGGIGGGLELVECGFAHARQCRPGMVREGFLRSAIRKVEAGFRTNCATN
jgi:hypothetical protein